MAKKIGIALGGGGARGLSHLGALRELSRLGIESTIVSGTSIGAIVAAVYASGNLSGLEKTASGISLRDIPKLLSPTISRKGIFSGKNALALLDQFLEVDLIEDLPRSFAAVSTDLRSGKAVVHTQGSIRDAVRASFAIPALFTPIVQGEMLLVDGGIVDPLPIRVCREMGADIVIAIDLFGQSSPLAIFKDTVSDESEQDEASTQKALGTMASALSYLGSFPPMFSLDDRFGREDTDRSANPNIIDIVETTVAVNQFTLTRNILAENPADVVIQPLVNHCGLLDFHKGEEMIECGVRAVRSLESELIALL